MHIIRKLLLPHHGRLSNALKKMCWWMPDRPYLKLMYFVQTGMWLRLHNPQSFNEKLQWLKLNNRRSEYTMMVDKVAVKEYAASLIGVEHVVPTLGVWSKFDEINFSKLPDKFVLKTSHDGGGKGVVICVNKEKFNRDEARETIEKSMIRNIYKMFREWPYKNVPRRVFAEEYIEHDSTEELDDYKFYCFNGVPHFCQVIKGRNTNKTMDFYDMDWQHQEFTGLNIRARQYVGIIPCPDHFAEMKSIASKMSQGIPFARIDLYEVRGKVYYGETTFFPNSGFGTFRPEKYNKILGEMLQLPINE